MTATREQRRRYEEKYRESAKGKRMRSAGEKRRWRQHRKARVVATKQKIAAIKAGKPCMDCGGVFHPACMEFDHRPGEKKKGIVSALGNRAWSVIAAEIAKCDLVCANCHRLRTVTRGWRTTPPPDDTKQIALPIDLDVEEEWAA